MPNSCTEEQARQFWSQRTIHVVAKYKDVSKKQQAYQSALQEREKKRTEEKATFLKENQQSLSAQLKPINKNTIVTVENLKFWIACNSWSFCKKCMLLHRQKLLPAYDKRPVPKHIKTCTCANARYITPSFSLIPDVLHNLTFDEICILRPFDLHLGDQHKQTHGYRKKTSMIRISWSKLSVQDKIQTVQDRNSRHKCEKAYQFLINLESSSYKFFIQKRLEHLVQNKRFNLYDTAESVGIECALWPHLYPYTNWCDTILEGRETRMSMKVSYITKVFSNVLDYGLSYELLQFHFDLWMFKTVSGALASAKKMKCSPARALNAKTFSDGYWKGQHRLLLDAVDQFGYPDVFVTISPYEWSFPFPSWINDCRSATGLTPTNIAGSETIHIAHVLEQIVRGYLCGSNSNKWSKHVFSYANKAGRSNINTYFYRFEFQQRGTVHLHLVVWLKNIKKTQHSLIRADIPWENSDFAFLINKLQPSDSRCLPLNNSATTFVTTENNTVMSIHYPVQSFVKNLRAYILTVVPTLQCRMDFQTSNGRSMLLRYVTSYATKWQDAYSDTGLYSTHLGPYQAAYRYIQEFQPCEPEMWLYMSAIKFSWSNSRTKHYIVPTSEWVANDKTHRKYCVRPREMEHLSFLQWLRTFNHRCSTPKLYKSGNTLVSLKMLSPFNPEYFFQEVLMNKPHRSLSELKHPKFDDLPSNLQHFASAVHVMPHLWKNNQAIKERFERHGNKHYYVNTLMSYTSSLADTLAMWHRHVLSTAQLSDTACQLEAAVELDHHQTSIVEHVFAKLSKRDAHYNTNTNYNYCSSPDEDDEQDEQQLHQSDHYHTEILPHNHEDIDWKKITLVTGSHGSGKSQIILATVRKCIAEGRCALVACPTGILAGSYRDIFKSSNIVCDTVHSSFSIPVLSEDQPRTNWALSKFDIIIIDELSMVSQAIAHHILKTVNEIIVRPVLLATGDPSQIQPIETVDKRINPVLNIFKDKHFWSLVDHFTLSSQHRVTDHEYETFLQHIRHWKPSEQLLAQIQKDRVIYNHQNPTDQQIEIALLQHPHATVLTFTRHATNRINQILISTIFAQEHPLATVQCDCEMDVTPIYKNMRVLITQNRNKTQGIVNGQLAVIHSIENATIFLKLPNGKIVNTYPITYIDKQNKSFNCYPFTPSYAMTIAKSQGQTLDDVILWFDIEKLPPGFAYVALSRVRTGSNLFLLTPIQPNHCIPVN